MINNPLSNQSYINKDFQTIYPELLDLVKKLTYKWDPTVSNESDPGVLLIKLNAIIADKNNYNIDKNILECFPDTVTQHQNAYKLYSQLGYNMHWYRSARGEISFQWKSEKLIVDGYTAGVKIPQFTMVTDEDKEIVYTITEECSLPTDGSISNVSALQGVIRDYEIGSDTLITPSVLDYRNRLYFPISNVAENGIFISDANRDANDEYNFVWRNPDIDTYTSWKPVDNLYIQPMGTKCYRFGIDQSNSTCYIEFPEDITNLMGEGIFIKYLQSDGASGNISAKRITQFYDDVEIEYNETTLTISQDALTTNNSSINNGKDPETIDSAYINYRKNVGTFDTLVTLRDYLNYIVNDEFEIVSNGVVADRTNDIQSSYKIVSTLDDTTTIKPNIVKTPEDKPEMSAFDLKTYFLEYSKWPKFTPSTDVESQKAAFKKAYDKSFRLQLNADDDGTVLDTPTTIKNYYKNAKRIEHDFIPKLSDKLRPLFFKNKFKLNMTVIPNNTVTQAQADEIERNVYESIFKNLSSNNIEFGEELSYETVYDICNNADSRIKAVALDSIEYVPYAVIYIDKETDDIDSITVTKEDGSTPLKLEYGLNEVPISTNVISFIDNLSESNYFTELTLNEQLALDICTKNVLAGTTPLYHPDKSFHRTVEQRDVVELKKLEKVTTHSEITFSGMATAHKGSYVSIDVPENYDSKATEDNPINILPNEAVFLYAPNLIADNEAGGEYSSGAKYIYYTLPSYTGKDEEYIPANIDYVLDRGQVLFLFWKEEDSKDSPYLYAKFTEGSILKATVKLIKSNVETYDYICSSLESSGYEGKGQILGTLNDEIYEISDTILSTTKTISLKKLNQVEFSDPHNYCYWITNDVIDDDGDKQYNLTFKYVEPTVEKISRNYQNGLVYVSNFSWPSDANELKGLTDERRLRRKGEKINDNEVCKKDEYIYLLRPNTHKLKYNAINNMNKEKYAEEQFVTDYIIEDILKPGDRIRCTGDIYQAAPEIFKYISREDSGIPINDQLGYTFPWGALRTPVPSIMSYLNNGESTFSIENFENYVDKYHDNSYSYKIVYDGAQWICTKSEGTNSLVIKDENGKDVNVQSLRLQHSKTRSGAYRLYRETDETDEEGNIVDTTIFTFTLGSGYQPKKYDFFSLSLYTHDGPNIEYYHSGNVGGGDMWEKSNDSLISSLSASPQYTLISGYRIELLNNSTEIEKECNFDYVLKSGEYFIYTDSEKKGFEMLSDGTKISVKVPAAKVSDEDKAFGLSYKVPAIDFSKIAEEHLSAFDDSTWHDFKVNKDSPNSEIITVTENQIIVLGEGTGIRVSLNSLSIPYYTDTDGSTTKLVYDGSYDNLKINSEGVWTKSDSGEEWESLPGVLSNYSLQYRATEEESWTTLPTSPHPKLCWDAYMILNLNSGPKNPQKLNYAHSQSMEFIHKDPNKNMNEPYQISSSNDKPIYIQTSSSINVTGGTNVDITGVNVDDEVVYMDLLTYETNPLSGRYVNKTTNKTVWEISKEGDTFNFTCYPQIEYYTVLIRTSGDLDILFDYEDRRGALYRITCTALSTFYPILGDDEYIGYVDLTSETLFIQNTATGEKLSYKKGSSTFSNSSFDFMDITTVFDIDCDLDGNTILPIEFMEDYADVKFSIGTTDNSTNKFLGYDTRLIEGVKKGVYYFNIPISDTQIGIKGLSIVIDSPTIEPISFRLKPLFVYTYESDIIDDDKNVTKELLEARVNDLNVGYIFDYAYEPVEDIKIDNPLNPKSYFNPSHICNKFTIPQISDIKIKTMNKRS